MNQKEKTTKYFNLFARVYVCIIDIYIDIMA